MQMLDKKIEYFIIAAEEGLFSAAARKLYLSQANLSKQITQLEIEMGVTLFDRDGYRPILTDAGEYFCITAFDILFSLFKSNRTNYCYRFWGSSVNLTGAGRSCLTGWNFRKRNGDICPL